jgi:hypothetical protein
MAQILSIDAHRQEKERQQAGPTGLNPRRPSLSDRQLWTRDYRETDNIMFAILKIKEILDYHLYYDDVWPYLLLSFMEAVHNLKQGAEVDLPGTGASLKDYVLSAMSQESKRDMSMVLLLIDLMEKSPNYRGTSNTP